jgi:hypothetical protein
VVVEAGSDFPQDTDISPADINKTPISNPDRNFRAMNILLLRSIFSLQILTYLYVPFNNVRKNREGARRTLKRFFLEDWPGPFIRWAVIKLGNNLIN